MAAAKKKKIFLIEDDEATMDVMQLVLTQAGHTVIYVDEQQDMSAHIAMEKPDLLLVDIHFRGLDMQKVIASLQKKFSMPIIIVSADPDIEKMAERTKVTGFLKKPFTIEELIALTENY